MRRAWCAVILVLGVLASAQSAWAQTRKVTYPITDLGALASGTHSYANRINASGQVVGSKTIDGTNTHACLWEYDENLQKWIFTDLGVLGSDAHATALGINDFGQIVGLSYTPYATDHACLWDYDGVQWSSATDLGGLTSDPLLNYRALGINNFGQVVGISNIDATTYHACLWDYDGVQWSSPTDLGGLGSDDNKSWAVRINDSGQIVGYSYIDATTCHACVWDYDGVQWSSPTDLGGLVPSLSSYAMGINDLGQVVGYSYIDAATRHACLWEYDGGRWTVRDLNAPGSSFYVREINNLGQVVGGSLSNDGSSPAWLRDSDGIMYDLNDFLPAGSGWRLSCANDINGHGQIVGRGTNPSSPYLDAFLMDTSAPTYSYTSTGSAVPIADPKGNKTTPASKAMTLYDNYSIRDLNVSVNLTHAKYADLKIELLGPNETAWRVLCNAGRLQGSGAQTIVFDDDGAAGTIQPVQLLSYYDAKSTTGTWTLRITDTVKNNKTGSLTSWTLTVVPEAP